MCYPLRMISSMIRILKDIISDISAGWLGIALILPFNKNFNFEELIGIIFFSILYFAVAVLLDKHLIHDYKI